MLGRVGKLDDLRVALMTGAMRLSSARRARIDGLDLVVAPGVCNPSPLRGMSFAALFAAALRDLRPGERVLDVGTGSGVWALMAARAGADVTATDLPHVPLDVVAESARHNRVRSPRTLSGDLFAPVGDERFSRVLFNPPFHFGEPEGDADRAYLGGADGEVVRRFLAELPAHLTEDGRGFLILPTHERRGYERDLSRFEVEVAAGRWMPVAGRIELLVLTPGAAG